MFPSQALAEVGLIKDSSFDEVFTDTHWSKQHLLGNTGDVIPSTLEFLQHARFILVFRYINTFDVCSDT